LQQLPQTEEVRVETFRVQAVRADRVALVEETSHSIRHSRQEHQQLIRVIPEVFLELTMVQTVEAPRVAAAVGLEP
jgi:ApbE superfamily uncharacterized protein (UPF0280 family)